jgi:trimeric autotransporter adhesin
MSTKTTFKRIALVAVAALGLGVVSSVAPATAASSAITAVSAGTPAPARVGVVSGTTVLTLTHPSAAATSFDVTAQITAAPVGSVNAGLEFSAAAVKAIGTPTY